jgi:hypothetical protein
MKHLDNVFHILFAGPLSWILADVIKLVRQPVQQLELWRDYIDTVWPAFFVRKVKNDSENSDVIVISLSDRVYQLKIESMLAIGLRLNGRQVVPIVRSRKDRWAIRYFKSFGIDKFLYWENPWRCQKVKVRLS